MKKWLPTWMLTFPLAIGLRGQVTLATVNRDTLLITHPLLTQTNEMANLCQRRCEAWMEDWRPGCFSEPPPNGHPLDSPDRLAEFNRAMKEENMFFQERKQQCFDKCENAMRKGLDEVARIVDEEIADAASNRPGIQVVSREAILYPRGEVEDLTEMILERRKPLPFLPRTDREKAQNWK